MVTRLQGYKVIRLQGYKDTSLHVHRNTRLEVDNVTVYSLSKLTGDGLHFTASKYSYVRLQLRTVSTVSRMQTT